MLSFVRSSWSLHRLEQKLPPNFFEECVINITGRLKGDLKIEEGKTVAVLETDKILCKDSIFIGNVFIKASFPYYYQRYVDGDILEVSGKFNFAKSFESNSGRKFNYPMFLAKDRIAGSISYAHVNKIDEDVGIRRLIFLFKNKIIDSILKALPNPYDGLVVGMILGVDGSLGSGLEEDYRRAGLIHIVVLSGFNVTIVAEAIRKMMPFSYKINLILSFVGIWVFAIMVGGSATVIRATIMASIVLLIRGLHEKYSVKHSLWIAAILMSIYNPFILGFDPSFHLSFLATCGIIYLSPIIERWFKNIPDKFEIRFTIAGTLATQIFVFPYLAYSMGEISIAAFVVNVLTVSFVPFIMLFGFIIFLTSIIHPSLSTMFSWLSWILIFYQLKIVLISSSFNYATIPLPKISLITILAVYMIIIIWVIWLNVNEAKKTVVV